MTLGVKLLEYEQMAQLRPGCLQVRPQLVLPAGVARTRGPVARRERTEWARSWSGCDVGARSSKRTGVLRWNITPEKQGEAHCLPLSREADFADPAPAPDTPWSRQST